MQIRALGTGSRFSKHPLLPACFAIFSENSTILIGCPPQAPAKLASLGEDLAKVSVILPLTSLQDQIGGIPELLLAGHNPIIAAPKALLDAVVPLLSVEVCGDVRAKCSVKTITKMAVKEEHFSETLTFVPNYLSKGVASFGLRLEASGIFISGATALNEDWLYKEMASELILHSCQQRPLPCPSPPPVEELSTLPMYLQKKIWLYGYEKLDKTTEHPFPMLYVPPLAWIFDSARRDRLLLKERFVRENAKKQSVASE